MPHLHRVNITDDRKVLNHGAACQKLTLFDAFRHPLLSKLARRALLLHVSVSNVNTDSTACTHISQLMLNAPVPYGEILFICYEDHMPIALSLTISD